MRKAIFRMLASNFKKILICLLTLFAAVTAGSACLADGLPEIDIICRPGTLIEPADITLSFTINNNTGHDCANLYISTSDGLVTEPLGSLPDGESITFTRHHSVTEQELKNEKIAYIFSYDDPDDPEREVNFTAETQIARAESRTECEFTRTFSSDTIPSGGTVTVLYTVRNTGNTAIEDLRVTDTLGDFTGRIESLDAGESRSLVSRITLTEPAVSSAKLYYETVSGTQTIEPADREIGISEAILDCTFNAGPDPENQDTYTGTLILHNNGNTDLSQIEVTDDFSGTVLSEGSSLTAGEVLTLTRTFGYRGDGGVRWRIRAHSDDGTEIDMITDTINLSLPEKTDLDDAVFSAEALTPRLKRSGNARIQLTVQNNGDANIYDLQITEKNAGDVLDLSTVSAGGTISREITLPVSGDTVFEFSLNYTDEDGWQNTAECAPVEIVIASDGVLPVDAENSIIDFSGGSIRIGGSSIFAVLLVIGILLLIILTIILIVVSHRSHIRKQVQKALEKQNKGRS